MIKAKILKKLEIISELAPIKEKNLKKSINATLKNLKKECSN